KDQIQRLVKRKAEVLNDYENNAPAERQRKIRKTGNEEINELNWKWFIDVTTRRVPVNGPLIQAQALCFASDLKIDTFHASNGWLESFLKRHNIVLGTTSGESGDVDRNVVSDWKEKLPTVCKGYRPQDIFNMDETGLFFRHSSTNKTYYVKGSDCADGKQSKECMTIGLCASMTGEKLTPIVTPKLLQNHKCESPA
ncbi:tigger transposable element-derived protein 4-like, partial [Limulus polyphemus]|uniref:Tigger transposable element-derived protein 4-like n=1 Tax=Limulus polyphemus TaxID=6850 RepID=A0ABM1C4D1_LIMPO